MKELIEQLLAIPVLEEPSPLYHQCATYLMIMERSGLAGNGKETEFLEHYQIDLWYRDRKKVIKDSKQLKDCIQHSFFCSIPVIDLSCDPINKIWRAAIKFEKVGEK